VPLLNMRLMRPAAVIDINGIAGLGEVAGGETVRVGALARYSAERVPRAADLVRRATNRARTSHAHDPAATEAWYAELAGTDGTDIIDGICKSILTGPCH